VAHVLNVEAAEEGLPAAVDVGLFNPPDGRCSMVSLMSVPSTMGAGRRGRARRPAGSDGGGAGPTLRGRFPQIAANASAGRSATEESGMDNLS
jgi:hypothetical protein